MQTIIISFKNFLNNNSNAIQAAMIIVLVGVTIYYAIATHRMARVMSKELELISQPYVALDRKTEIIVQQDISVPNKIADKTDWIRLKFTIMNLGKIPVKYTQELASFNKEVEKINSPGVVLFPGQSLDYTTKVFKIDEVNPKQIKGEAEIKIIYWALGLPKRKYFHRRKYEINLTSDIPAKIIKDDAGEEK